MRSVLASSMVVAGLLFQVHAWADGDITPGTRRPQVEFTSVSSVLA